MGLQVLFDEHTDSSLLTLSLLCPGAAGLELRDLLGREEGDGEAEAEGGAEGEAEGGGEAESSRGRAGAGGWLSVEAMPGVTPYDIEARAADLVSQPSPSPSPNLSPTLTRLTPYPI